MFYIPDWVSNILLLVTCWLSGFQLVQLKQSNPIVHIQFVMIIFCLFMVVVITLNNNHAHPWMSLVYFVIAAGTLTVMIRQHRMLPPMRQFE